MSEDMIFLVDNFSTTIVDPGGEVEIPISETRSLGFNRYSFQERVEVSIRIRTTNKGSQYLYDLIQDISRGDLR